VHFSRSHDAVIRVYDDAGNVIKTHEHAGEFKEWRSLGAQSSETIKIRLICFSVTRQTWWAFTASVPIAFHIFKRGIIGSDTVLDTSISFPNVFGTVRSVPDTGSTLAMLSISLLGLGLCFNRLSRGSTSLSG